VLNFEDAGLRQALTARDVSAVFRLVVAAGVSQRRLAELVRMGLAYDQDDLVGCQVG
jgi:hypothetical protein